MCSANCTTERFSYDNNKALNDILKYHGSDKININTFISTPISKSSRTGGGKERAYMSAILKNRARNNLSRAFMRGFVPSTGMSAIKITPTSMLSPQNRQLWMSKQFYTAKIGFHLCLYWSTFAMFMFWWRIITQISPGGINPGRSSRLTACTSRGVIVR